MLFGILFGGPAIFAAALSFIKHLPLIFTPQIYFAWALPIAVWLYLSSLKLGMTEKAIYLERFFLRRSEYQFTDIVSVCRCFRTSPSLEISVRGNKNLVSIALAPFDKPSLEIFVQALKDNVKGFEDQISVATPKDPASMTRRLLPALLSVFVGVTLSRLIVGLYHRCSDATAFATGLHSSCVDACLKSNPTVTTCPQFCDCMDRGILHGADLRVVNIEFDRLRTGTADDALKARYQGMQDRCAFKAQGGKSEGVTGP
ncbi:MAG: hypothetical protein ACHQ51_00195 [Elusimicrobiota bacterium]